MKQTAVEFLEEKLKGDKIFSLDVIITKAKEMEKQMLCDLVQSLKDYTLESRNILGHDEREPIEFVEIFLNKR